MPLLYQPDLHPASLLFCITAVAAMMAAFAFSSARATPGFRTPLRYWGASMLATGTAAVLFLLRPQLEGAAVYLLPNAAALCAAALLGTTAASMQGPLERARPGWWLATASLVALMLAYAQGFPYRVLVSIAAGGLAAVVMLAQVQFWPLLKTRRAFPEIALHGLLTVAWLAFAVRAVSVWPESHPVPDLLQWVPGNPMLLVSVVFVAGASLAFFSLLHERQREALSESMQRDSLTGLYTRGIFFEKAQQWLEAAPEGTLFAVVMADIDHFKRVNDTFGHIAGDHVIAHAARALQSTTRLDDLAGRYGGEEFCVLLKNCDEAQAIGFAQRLLRSTDSAVSLRDGRSVAVTFSVGFAHGKVASRYDQLEQVLDRADQALLRAKSSGRNRAEAAPPREDTAPAPLQAT